MTLPKFKSENDEIVWDCLFDVKLSKYYDCFDKVRKQFYNHLGNDGENLKVLIDITNQLISQTSSEIELKK